MRTLVISDLHLGGDLRRDVLREDPALEALLAALDGVDRLVLLGDVVELLDAHPPEAMAAAEPVLRAIGSRIGGDREVVVVPGNHDAALVRDWVGPQASLAADAPVPLDATALLGQLSAFLEPARVRVHYPGVWLAEGVWATHGHYLDRHLLPAAAYGVARGLLGRLPQDGATPLDYERAGGPSVTRIEARLNRRLPRSLAPLVDDMLEFLRAATMPASPEGAVGNRFARAMALVLGAQMRRASIPALARVVHRLGLDAGWALFGHVHRCGPLPGDEPRQWQGPGGRPRILNTGSWVYEPLLVHHTTPPHPYWPGGAVLLEPGRDPRAIGLLDHLGADALH